MPKLTCVDSAHLAQTRDWFIHVFTIASSDTRKGQLLCCLSLWFSSPSRYSQLFMGVVLWCVSQVLVRQRESQYLSAQITLPNVPMFPRRSGISLWAISPCTKIQKQLPWKKLSVVLYESVL